MTYNNESIRILHNGLKIPVIGASASFKQALDNGYRMFDLSEDEDAQKEFMLDLENSGIMRYDCTFLLHIPVHVHTYDETERYIKHALKRLNTSYIDIVLLNSTPKGFHSQCWKALEDLYKDGCVHAIGTGPCTAAHLDRLLSESTISPMASEAVIYPGHPETELKEYCDEHRIDPIAVCPSNASAVLESKEVDILSRKYGIDPIQLVVNYQAEKGALCMVPDTSNSKEALQDAMWMNTAEPDRRYLDNMKDYAYSS